MQWLQGPDERKTQSGEKTPVDQRALPPRLIDEQSHIIAIICDKVECRLPSPWAERSDMNHFHEITNNPISFFETCWKHHKLQKLKIGGWTFIVKQTIRIDRDFTTHLCIYIYIYTHIILVSHCVLERFGCCSECSLGGDSYS